MSNWRTIEPNDGEEFLFGIMIKGRAKDIVDQVHGGKPFSEELIRDVYYDVYEDAWTDDDCPEIVTPEPFYWGG